MMLPIFRAETILILAERPGDEVRECGTLIAALCRAGRPPFVVVLTDGAVRDAGSDSRVRAGLQQCGLAGERMLMFGIAGAVPAEGPVFDAVVHALCFVGWRHDCNVLCAPAEPESASHAVARAAVATSGVGLVTRSGGQFTMVTPPRRSAREAGPLSPGDEGGGLLFPVAAGDTISRS